MTTTNPFAYDAKEPTCSECGRTTHQNFDQLQECLTSLQKRTAPDARRGFRGRLDARGSSSEGTQVR